MSAVGGNYISDGAIMAWLESHQSALYGDLKESMDLAERRSDFTSKLVDIKAHLEEANRTKDFTVVDRELQALMTKYGSDPELAELCDSLRPIATKINEDCAYASSGYAKAYEQYEEDLAAYEAAAAAAPDDVTNGVIKAVMPDPPPPPTTSYTPEDLQTWTTQIDGKIDVAGKNDQLTMIHLQELKAEIDQSSQLGSAWIAGGDKTLDRIIGNLA